MPAYYPEGDFMRAQDDNHRSLQKLVTNFANFFGGDVLVADDGVTLVTTDDTLNQVVPD